MWLLAYLLVGVLVTLRILHVNKPRDDNWSWYLFVLTPFTLLWPFMLGDLFHDRQEERIQAERDRVERARHIAALEKEAFESFEDFMARLDRELETPKERAEETPEEIAEKVRQKHPTIQRQLSSDPLDRIEVRVFGKAEPVRTIWHQYVPGGAIHNMAEAVVQAERLKKIRGVR